MLPNFSRGSRRSVSRLHFTPSRKGKCCPFFSGTPWDGLRLRHPDRTKSTTRVCERVRECAALHRTAVHRVAAHRTALHRVALLSAQSPGGRSPPHDGPCRGLSGCSEYLPCGSERARRSNPIVVCGVGGRPGGCRLPTPQGTNACSSTRRVEIYSQFARTDLVAVA